MSRESRFQNLLIAGWGGIFGVMFAFFVSAFQPRPFESSMKIQLGDPPSWLATQGVSSQQVLDGLRSENVLTPLAESFGIKPEGGTSAESLLRNMIQVERIRNTYLIKVTVRHADGEIANQMVTSLVKSFDDHFTADFRDRATMDITKKFEGNKDKRERLTQLQSEIKDVLPEYFEEHVQECRSGSDAENEAFDVANRLYERKRKALEERRPEFVSVIKEYEELCSLLFSRDRSFGNPKLIPYSCIQIIEEASAPARSSLPNLATILGAGGAVGFCIALIFCKVFASVKSSGKPTEAEEQDW